MVDLPTGSETDGSQPGQTARSTNPEDAESEVRRQIKAAVGSFGSEIGRQIQENQRQQQDALEARLGDMFQKMVDRFAGLLIEDMQSRRAEDKRAREGVSELTQEVAAEPASKPGTSESCAVDDKGKDKVDAFDAAETRAAEVARPAGNQFAEAAWASGNFPMCLTPQQLFPVLQTTDIEQIVLWEDDVTKRAMQMAAFVIDARRIVAADIVEKCVRLAKVDAFPHGMTEALNLLYATFRPGITACVAILKKYQWTIPARPRASTIVSSLQDHNFMYKKLSKALNITGKEAIYIYVRSFTGKKFRGLIEDYMRHDSIKDLELVQIHAEDRARWLDESESTGIYEELRAPGGGGSGEGRTRGSTSRSIVCFTCNERGHTAAQCASRASGKVASVAASEEAAGPENGTIEGETVNKVSGGADAGAGDKKQPLRCYNCNEVGHFSRECPKKKKAKSGQAEASTSASAEKKQAATETSQAVNKPLAVARQQPAPIASPTTPMKTYAAPDQRMNAVRVAATRMARISSPAAEFELVQQALAGLPRWVRKSSTKSRSPVRHCDAT